MQDLIGFVGYPHAGHDNILFYCNYKDKIVLG